MCVGGRGMFEKTKKEKQRYFLPKSYRLFPAVKTEYKIKRRNLKPTALKKKRKENCICTFLIRPVLKYPTYPMFLFLINVISFVKYFHLLEGRSNSFNEKWSIVIAYYERGYMFNVEILLIFLWRILFLFIFFCRLFFYFINNS